jgi:quercetin dioxygenase-like cupin family protein
MLIAPRVFRIGELEIRFHCDPADTDAAVAVFESVIPPNAHVPVPHSHDGYDENVFGLAGVCHFTVEGTEVAVRAGDRLYIPRGTVHSFVNRGTETTRVLVVVTPGLLGPDYFREVADIVNASRPPDRARLADAMRRHGMTPAPVPALAR